MEKKITSGNFDAELAAGPLMVDFWAEWCGPCRMIGPMVEQMAKEFEGRVTVGKCNVDEERELPARFGIRNIPTLLFFKNGELVEKHVGALSSGDLKAKFEQLLG